MDPRSPRRGAALLSGLAVLLTQCGSVADCVAHCGAEATPPVSTQATVTILTPVAVTPRPACGLAVCPDVSLECTSPAGVELSPTGSVEPPDAGMSWAVFLRAVPCSEQPGLCHPSIGSNAAMPTFLLPLYNPTDPPIVLSLAAAEALSSNLATLLLRVVDTTPPTPGQPAATFDCDWGGTSASGTECMHLALPAADRCDTDPSTVIDALTVTDASGAVVYTYTTPTTCLAAPPGVDTASVTFEVDWHAVDRWNNASVPQHSRYHVLRDAPAASCAQPVHAEFL